MYQEHPQLKNIGDNATLWKFMDLPKFLNILNGKLYFNRLNNFEDVYEGTYPKYNECNRDKMYADGTRIPEELYNQVMMIAQNHMYVSCFHNSRSETAFMWKLYGKDDGIAIKTTGKRLKASFDPSEEIVHISEVTYIDYNRSFMPEGNLMYLGTHKRKSFQAEKEYRCIVLDDKKIHDNEKGLLIDIDLEQLFMGVYISPYAPDYMFADIKRILQDRGIKSDVRKSQLLTLS